VVRLILLFGLLPLADLASLAQNLRQPVSQPAGGLSVSVTSNVGRGCGAAIPRPVLEQSVETQLRAAGIGVGRLHTAQLAADVDCVPVLAGGRKAGLTVHYCLSLAQSVWLPSGPLRTTLATTWRKCESYTCGIGKCDIMSRPETHTLVNAMIAAVQPKVTADAAQASNPPSIPRGPGPAELVYRPLSQPARGPAVIYIVYILTCLTVLLRWACRRHQFQ